VLPEISVIVPCRNEKTHIEACIRSLLNQKGPLGDIEVIVADGMSDDGTREILRSLAQEDRRLLVVDNPFCTTATGLNAAIRKARGRVVVRMDAHTKCASDYLFQCLAVLHSSGASNVGGPARTHSEGYVQSAICAAFHSAFAVGGARFHDVEYEGYVDTVTYGCWFRDLHNRIGFFDEELRCNEDDEFNLRLTQAGEKIWQSPQIKSWYTPRASLGALFRQYWKYGYWKVRVIQKRRIPASIRHVAPGSFVFVLMFLPLLFLLWEPAGWAWFGLVLFYLSCIAAASIQTAAKRGWRYLPLLPLVFPCYQLSYGFGFLCGIWDFLILGNRFTATLKSALDI